MKLEGCNMMKQLQHDEAAAASPIFRDEMIQAYLRENPCLTEQQYNDFLLALDLQLGINEGREEPMSTKELQLKQMEEYERSRRDEPSKEALKRRIKSKQQSVPMGGIHIREPPREQPPIGTLEDSPAPQYQRGGHGGRAARARRGGRGSRGRRGGTGRGRGREERLPPRGRGNEFSKPWTYWLGDGGPPPNS